MTEQVEDVKTFLQILLVLCVLGGGIVVRIAADNAGGRYIRTEAPPNKEVPIDQHYSSR